MANLFYGPKHVIEGVADAPKRAVDISAPFVIVI